MLSRRLLRIKVIKALYAHLQSGTSPVVSEKNLLYGIDKAYELYYQMLDLIVEVARYAGERIEIARNKKLPTPEDLNPNTRFVDNAVIRQFADSRRLNDYLEKHALGWGNAPDLIRSLYQSFIETECYRAYMASDDRRYRTDVKLAGDFYLSVVEDNPAVENVLEEQSIFWSDDLDFALIMVMRTLEDCRQKQTDLPLLPQFKSDDDLKFARDLFRTTVRDYESNLRYIERFTENWDVERIAFIDNLILVAAMTELLLCDDVPVLVTLDEYIEIAKYYSTPGSGVFVNGVLDKIVGALTSEGRIAKTGRGLL